MRIMDVYVYAYDVNGYRREPSFVGWGRRTYRLFLLGAFPPKVTAWPDPTKLEQTGGGGGAQKRDKLGA